MLNLFHYVRYSIYYSRDLWNRLRFGPGAPRSCECFEVPVSAVDVLIKPRRFIQSRSGKVVGGEWDQSVVPLDEVHKYRIIWSMLDSDQMGESEDVLAYYSNRSKYSDEELQARYEHLKESMKRIRSEGRLRTRLELDPDNFRERGGILVHVGARGQLIFGGAGYHRLTIARFLGFETMPVCIGVVHPQAVRDGHFADLRARYSKAAQGG